MRSRADQPAAAIGLLRRAVQLGLPPGIEATTFEPFVRGPGTEHPGLGLGLATVKRIVETHGGAVGVESHVGAGCRFWMDLPKAVGPAGAHA